MLSPVKVVDIELSQPLQTLNNLVGYIRLQVLVRLHGVPLGELSLPVINGQCQAHDLGQAVLEKYSWAIVTTQLKNNLHCPPDRHQIDLAELVRTTAPSFPPPPSQYVTVAICTRDRPADLQLCLEALCGLASGQSRPIREILVIDNAPSNQATQQLVTQQYPQVRYICEPRPGLNWARNRAIVEAAGEIIAFADDDVVVDGGWVTALARVFAEQPEVMAVTGLVRPYELETDAQVLFEMNGGFGKGFERKQYYVPKGEKIPWYLLGTGNLGTGANMAYRRSVFTTIGGFNPALDVGTITNGAGDLEMFFRILKTGHTLVYEPSALIWHRHRREYAKLRSQLHNNGSVYAYFACAAQAYPDEARSFLRLGVLWFLSWHCRRAVTLAAHPTRFPHDLAWAELTGCLKIGGRYGQSSKNARQLAEKFATADRATELQALFPDRHHRESDPVVVDPRRLPASAVAVRSVELTQPLDPLTDVEQYASVRVFVHWQGGGLGHVDMANHYQPIYRTQLIHTIVIHLWERLLWPDRQINAESRWHQTCSVLRQHYLTPILAAQAGIPATLPAHVPVSVIVGTYDRPTDLQNCLKSLLAQVTPRRVEIIVIDNHPASGLTAPIVAQFPTVRLIEEPRQGVAYARNAGIIASNGEIIITTDDDVTMPAEWLEKLVAPFTRADVMGVTGNILPVELGATSQQLFESYGGLGRGFYAFEVSGDWFERSWMHVVPTWELGGTANAAFRASVFSDPEIGLMDEALGPGMPSGVGEDIYLFYKILKAGHTMMYAAEANVWHRHRNTMKALRHQLYNYSKGFVSYNLTTLRRDGDWRVLLNLGFYLPMFHLRRIYDRLRGKSTYPIGLTLVEIAGNLMGPIALLRSRQQVKRLGRSAPYVTPNITPLPNR
jgi:O-antigen biosynthesis protein